MEHEGVAHWLLEFIEVKELILRRAEERGATEGQLRELEQDFELGRKYAIEDGFTASEKIEPADDDILQSRVEVLNEILESCLVRLEEE